MTTACPPAPHSPPRPWSQSTSNQPRAMRGRLHPLQCFPEALNLTGMRPHPKVFSLCSALPLAAGHKECWPRPQARSCLHTRGMGMLLLLLHTRCICCRRGHVLICRAKQCNEAAGTSSCARIRPRSQSRPSALDYSRSQSSAPCCSGNMLSSILGKLKIRPALQTMPIMQKVPALRNTAAGLHCGARQVETLEQTLQHLTTTLSKSGASCCSSATLAAPCES